MVSTYPPQQFFGLSAGFCAVPSLLCLHVAHTHAHSVSKPVMKEKSGTGASARTTG